MAGPLTITVEQTARATIIRLVGSASTGADVLLEEQFSKVADAKPALVVVDLTRLDYLASQAMGQLVTLHKSVKYGGGRVILAGPTAKVLEAFHFARLGSLLTILPSVDAALWNVT